MQAFLRQAALELTRAVSTAITVWSVPVRECPPCHCVLTCGETHQCPDCIVSGSSRQCPSNECSSPAWAFILGLMLGSLFVGVFWYRSYHSIVTGLPLSSPPEAPEDDTVVIARAQLVQLKSLRDAKKR